MIQTTLLIALLLFIPNSGVSCHEVATSTTEVTDEVRFKEINELLGNPSALDLSQIEKLLKLIFAMKGSAPFNAHTFEKLRNWEIAAIDLRNDSPCRLYLRDQSNRMVGPQSRPSLNIWCTNQCYTQFEDILRKNGVVDTRGHRTMAGRNISAETSARIIQETINVYELALSASKL